MSRREHLAKPDPSMHWAGEEDPRRGPRQYELLVEWGLSPSTDLLEIGCGTGRLAYEVIDRLDEGSYTGFDISPEPIAWLNENWASQLSNFRFDHFDVANPRWRKVAAQSADEVQFPYDDGVFDLVAAFDVFMHMRGREIRNYLGEVRRVLRPGGLCVMTWMIINERDDRPSLADREFVPIGDGVHTRFPELDGVSMAYDEALALEMIAESGLDLVVAVEGRWHRPFTKREGRVPASDLFVASA